MARGSPSSRWKPARRSRTTPDRDGARPIGGGRRRRPRGLAGNLERRVLRLLGVRRWRGTDRRTDRQSEGRTRRRTRDPSPRWQHRRGSRRGPLQHSCPSGRTASGWRPTGDSTSWATTRRREIVTPGAEIVNLETILGPVAMTTCENLRFPELSRALCDRCADLLLITSAGPRARLARWHPHPAARSRKPGRPPRRDPRRREP